MACLAEPQTVFNLPPTPELKRDLAQIDRLIAVLRVTPTANLSDVDDMNWLLHRRRFLLATLASREAQRRQRIASLDMWRSGGRITADALPQVA